MLVVIFFFQDLSTHSRFVTCHTLGQVHSDWVRRVKYIPVKEFVISCSGSGKDSLVVRDIDDKKRKTYTFKVAKVNTKHSDQMFQEGKSCVTVFDQLDG